MSTTLPPTLITEFIKRDLPTLSLTDTTSYTTPSVTVPPNSDNPYIVRTTNPSGTVFIAVGAIVGAILLGFILYHLLKSFNASRLAKKAFSNDKEIYEKYHHNNNTAYGLTPSTTLNFVSSNNPNISKLPLLTQHPSKSITGLGGGLTSSGSQLGDTSTLYQSDIGVPTSKHDLTKMFISPTAEVMSHKRVKSAQFAGSVSSFGNGSSTNLNNSPVNNRHSTIIPNLYINNEINNSDYSLNTNKVSNSSIPNVPNHLQTLNANANSTNNLNVKPNRKTIPSMYLEDLIDE